MAIASQQSIKDSNLKRLYEAIYQNRGISRAQLAKATQLSKTTVSTLVDELIRTGFILDTGSFESDHMGRRPNGLTIRSHSHYVIVLDWIVDTVSISVVDIAGITVYNHSVKLSATENYISQSRTLVDGLLNALYPKACILGICVTVSAMIDEKKSEIYSTTLSLENTSNINLIRELKKSFPEFAVALLEDTACYAYAEKVFTHISEQNFAFINFGRGIGATLFVNGNMLGNASGSITQFGHYSPEFSGALCPCGNYGCIETLLSEPYIKTRLMAYGNSALSQQKDVTFTDLNQAALLGDDAACRLLDSMADILAKAVANLICMVNPELIVLGGSCPALGQIFLQRFQQALSRHGFQKMVATTASRYSQLDPDACKNGAMKYFFDYHYSFTQDNSGKFWIG